MSEPVIRRRKDEDKVQDTKPARRENTPVERWRPFEQYDKFREPGRSWRGDDPEVRPNPNPSTLPQRRSDAPLAEEVQQVASAGRFGDTMLAHITPREAALLKMLGGSGTVNPVTGLPEFFEGSTGADSHGSNSTGQAGNSDTSGGYADAGNTDDGQGGGNRGNYSGPAPGQAGYYAADEVGMYSGPPKAASEYDASNNWGLGIGDAQAYAGFSPGFLGFLGYASEVGATPAMAGVTNSVNNLGFADVAGFLAGAVASSVVSPAVGGLLGGGLVGSLAGKAAGSMAGNAVSNAVTSGLNNSTVSSPNATAPGVASNAPGGSPGGQVSGQSGSDSSAPATVQQQANPLNSQETITIDGIQFRRPGNSQTAGVTTNPGQFTLN